MSTEKMFVLKVSGKIINEENVELVKGYASTIRQLASEGYRIVVVVGGGPTARKYISCARTLGLNEAQCDIIGIEVSRLNALLLASAIGLDIAYTPIPRSIDDVARAWHSGRIVVMGGLQPGQSTAGTAAVVAEFLGVKLMLYATDVDGIYDKDPKRFRDAKLLRYVSVDDLEKILMSSQTYSAGGYQLLDPIALRIVRRSRIRVIVFNGMDPSNIVKALRGEIGSTVIPSPEG